MRKSCPPRIASRLAGLLLPRAYLIKTANKLIEKSKFEAADSLLSNAMRLHADRIELRIAYAYSAHNAGRYSQAVERWAYIKDKWPDYAMAWSGCAANFRELGALEQAKTIIEKALSRFPNDAIALSEGVRIFDRLGDHARSLALSHRMTYIGLYGPMNPVVQTMQMFMYWTNDEMKAPAADAWRSIYPDFRVFGDADVIPLLPPDFVSLYNTIRLPSAKSDLARFLLLRKYGGFYIDAHIGPTSPADLMKTLDLLSSRNLILFGKGWTMTEAHDFDLMNGILAAQKGAPELDIVIDTIIENIRRQKAKEDAAAAYVDYTLHDLTGTFVLVRSFFDIAAPRPALKKEFEGKVFVHFMKDNTSSGFEIAAYYTYRIPGGHWSERQLKEPFFLS